MSGSTVMRYFAWFLGFSWTLVVASVWGLFVFFWVFAYADVLEFFISWGNLAEKKTQIATQILSKQRFEQIRYVLLLASVLGLLSLLFVWTGAVFLSKWIFDFFQNLHLAYLRYASTWQTLQKRQKIIVWACFIVGLSPIFWRVCVYAYWVDEVFSYLFLVNRGVLVSLTYYPGPNNHVFFTAVVAFWAQWTKELIEPIFLMRLAAFGGVVMASWVLFAWFLVRQGFEKACWVLLLFLFQSPVQMYGYLGRGYAWEMLFFLCTWIGFWEWCRQGRKFYFGFACVSAIAGFYTLPTFLYAFGGLVVFLWWFSRQGYKHFIRLNISLGAVLGIVLGLYLPIILLNGWEALAGNSWLKVGRDTFWQTFLSGQYGAEVIGFWGFDLPLWATWLVWILFFWRGWCAGKEWRGWIAGLFFVPMALLLYQQILPPARVWSYGAVVLAVVALAGKPSRYLFLGVFLGNFIFYWQFFPTLPAHIEVARSIYQKQASTVFANEDTYQMFIRYLYTKQHKPLQIYTQCEAGRQDADICIFSKKQALPSCFLPARYELWLENSEVRIFIKKRDSASNLSTAHVDFGRNRTCKLPERVLSCHDSVFTKFHHKIATKNL